METFRSHPYDRSFPASALSIPTDGAHPEPDAPRDGIGPLGALHSLGGVVVVLGNVIGGGGVLVGVSAGRSLG